MSSSVEKTTETSEEKNEFLLNEKVKMFKITIMVCAIYGIISLVAIFIFFFTSMGKVIYNDMFAFFITMIIGMISIIIFLSNEIYNLKTTVDKDKINYDSEMCPDYWKLEYLSNSDVQKSFTAKQGINPYNFSYKCKLNDEIFSRDKIKSNDDQKTEDNRKGFAIGKAGDKDSLYVTINEDNKNKSGISKDEQLESFKKIVSNMSGYTYNNNSLTKDNDKAITSEGVEFDENNIPIACDTVYPLYMSVMDQENKSANSSEPSNRYRCAYAKACGVNWTDAGCTP